MTIFKRDEVEQAPAERPVAPEKPTRREVRRMEHGEITVVGGGAKLEGTVVSAGSLRVDGTVKGQIQADGDVVLSPNSSVEADITAKSVSVAGSLRGTITVTGRAELKSGGRVEGNITCAALVVEEGATFDGQSTMARKGGQSAVPAKAERGAPERGPGDQRAEVPVP